MEKEFCFIAKKTKYIKAKTFDEARRQFARTFPDHEVQQVQGSADDLPNKLPVIESIGKCEITGQAIFEHDKYETDNEGVMWIVDAMPFKKKVLNAEYSLGFDEGIKNMSDYDKGRADGRLTALSNEDNIYHAMDCHCIESLDPNHYEMWLKVLNALSTSRVKAKVFTERMGY